MDSSGDCGRGVGVGDGVGAACFCFSDAAHASTRACTHMHMCVRVFCVMIVWADKSRATRSSSDDQ